ncbi:very short patch repair endonuclease [Paenibacillus artemisiicola]|uniref:very short patch repair endonuclease n=1 Tax=Paenibacillus artemisiicola TaxID=1172618 RepID=UPI0030B8C8B2
MPDADFRSKSMGRIRGKNTKLEQSVSKALWRNGHRFRKNVLSLYGKPDIAIKKYKIVIFIDSCFWHGCKSHFKLPSKNSDYWSKKINRNIQRDMEVTQYYINKEWVLIRIWEHDLKSCFDMVIEQACKKVFAAKRQTFDCS